MHFILSAPGVWFNLPRDGGVAYAAQESWVQNDTIRVCNLSIFFRMRLANRNPQENIVFGSPFDETRHKKVIYQCALERDLTLFEAGDKTEVGA